MTTNYRTAVLDVPIEPFVPDEAELAAVAFLARYSGRTLDAYRHDLRNLFQWSADHGLAVLKATRAHLELYRSSMEEGGWPPPPSTGASPPPAASTASPTSTAGSPPTRPTTFAAQQVHPSERRGLDRGELGRFLFTAERFDHAHAALAVLLGLNGLRVSEACETNIEDMPSNEDTGCYGSSVRATSRLSSPWSPALLEPSISLSANAETARSWCATMEAVSTGARPTAGFGRSGSERGSGWYIRTCSEQPLSWLPWTPASLSAKSKSQPGTPILAPRPSTTGAARTSTSTPRTSSSPSLPAGETIHRATGVLAVASAPRRHEWDTRAGVCADGIERLL